MLLSRPLINQGVQLKTGPHNEVGSGVEFTDVLGSSDLARRGLIMAARGWSNHG
jgi:hypothetical protein